MTEVFYYKTLDKYLKELLTDLRMSMEIRVIANLLFIEKVRFLSIELRTKNEIFEEILAEDYKLIKKIPCTILTDKEITLSLSGKFIYQVEEQDLLFYFVWSDSLGNVVQPGRPFQVVSKGDTFTLH